MSTVDYVRGGANTSLNLDDVSTLIKNARRSTRPGTIHSCQLCNVQELDPLSYVDTDDHIEPYCVVKYRGTTVLEGGAKGCDFFQELIIGLESSLHEAGYGDGSGHIVEFRPQKWICKLRFDRKFRWAYIKWTSVEGELPPMPSNGEARHSDPRNYFFVADEDDPASGSIAARPLSHNWCLAQTTAQAQNFLYFCETQHEACSRPDPSFLPTRLLELHSDSNGRIFVNLEMNTAKRRHTTTRELEYVALSYCWGGAQELHLSTESEKKLTRGIHVSSLPQTLQDAVLVTWEHGYRFKWIDSLCIRQDDQYDLDIEIAQMPAIYENSHITISAARASHSREGFLLPSSLPPRSRAACRLPLACPDGNLGSVIVFNSNGQFVSPFDKRAWTLQEYLLSRRVLRFTNFGPHWTCREGRQIYGFETDSLPSLYVEKLSSIHSMYRGFNTREYTCRDWMNIVQEYTKRSMTDSADKLKAISGVAKKWGACSRDSYAAGLWRSHLPRGLLWTFAQPHRPALTTYLAPSWSWASLDGEIDWFDHLYTKEDTEIGIISCSLTPTYKEAPDGRVVSGSLIIRGRLQKNPLTSIFLLWQRIP